MKNCTTIMVVVIDKRNNAAPTVQEILTRHGCIISTRIGLHQSSSCSDNGLVILHLCGKDKEVGILKNDLGEIEGVKVKLMKIELDD